MGPSTWAGLSGRPIQTQQRPAVRAPIVQAFAGSRPPVVRLWDRCEEPKRRPHSAPTCGVQRQPDASDLRGDAVSPDPSSTTRPPGSRVLRSSASGRQEPPPQCSASGAQS
eukprot:1409457-Prymnesium_polylepis.1